MRRGSTELGVPCPRNAVVTSSVEEVEAFGFPCVLKTTRGGYDGKGVWVVRSADGLRRGVRGRGAKTGVRILAEELVDFRRELSALVARSPSGQAAAYPVVASTQRDGICHEVIAPAPDLDPAWPRRRRRSRCGSPGARRHRHPGGRALRDQRRPDPGQRARDAPAQHRPLDPGRRGHQPVREPPARRLDLPLGSPAPRAAVDGDGQHPRRRPRAGRTCTTATRTRWRATRGCGCTSTARRSARPQGRPRQRVRRRPRRLPRARAARRGLVPWRPRHDDSASDGEHERQPLVGIVMGSDSDWPVMKAAPSPDRVRRRRTRPTSSPRTGCRSRCSAYGRTPRAAGSR
jgi:hypothetical protein